MNEEKKQYKFTTNTKIIYDYMKKHNLTKNQFAKLCKISVTTLNKVLRGFNYLRISIVYNLLVTLNVKCKDLFIQ